MLSSIKKIPIYGGSIAIVVAEDPKDLYKLFSKESLDYVEIGTDYLYAHSLVLDHKGRNCYTIVLNFKSEAGDMTYGTIAHEALHIKNMLFERRHISINTQNDEADAYFVGYVIDDVVMPALRKWKLIDKLK